jgi:hypothetical protein
MFKCISNVDSNIVANNDEYFRLMDIAWEASDIVLSNLNGPRLSGKVLQPFPLVVMSLYYKSRDCMLSIATLCACGHTREAYTIVRKLLETAVNLKYISMDPTERAPRFGKYGAVRSYFLAQRVKNDPTWPENVRKDLASISDEIRVGFESSKSLFCDQSGKLLSKYSRYWDGKSIPKMAKECGLVDDLSAYEVFNFATHTSSSDVGIYFDMGKKQFRSGADASDVPGVLLESVRLFTIPLRLVAAEFKLDLNASLAQVERVLNYSGNKWVAGRFHKKLDTANSAAEDI